MKVQAFRKGFYNLELRLPLDVFRLKSPEDFSRTWMRVVDPCTPLNMEKPHLSVTGRAWARSRQV